MLTEVEPNYKRIKFGKRRRRRRRRSESWFVLTVKNFPFLKIRGANSNRVYVPMWSMIEALASSELCASNMSYMLKMEVYAQCKTRLRLELQGIFGMSCLR